MLNNQRYHQIYLLVISAFFATFFALNQPLHFNGDSEQYLRYAFQFVGNDLAQLYYYRTIGFPLFMILTGVTLFESFWFFLFIQALMSTLIPWFVYRSFHKINLTFAFLVGTFTIVTLTPYTYMNVIMTDNLAIFLRFGIFWALASYVQTKSLRSLFMFVMTMFLLSLVRPSTSLMFAGFIALLLLIDRKLWARLGIACVLYISLVYSTSWYTNNVLWSDLAESRTFGASFGGKMLFWNIWGTAHILLNTQFIQPENGAHTVDLYNSVLEFYQNNPPVQIHEYVNLCESDVDCFVNHILSSPSLLNHYFLWSAIDSIKGPAASDSLFLNASLEALLRKPTSLYYIWDGLVSFFLGTDITYNNGARQVNLFIGYNSSLWYSYTTSSYISDMMREQLRIDTLKRNVIINNYKLVNLTQNYLQLSLKLIGSITAILFWYGWWK